MDPIRRSGPEAMAVDEWLLETTQVPVLRVYGWQGEWGSLGYFGKLSEAKAAFPDLDWVRRWTGGGVVDHRADWTYTLVIPAGEALASERGAESYRQIHTALAETLRGEGRELRLCDGLGKTGQAACFLNPVDYDLVGAMGEKLAGAGQRRSRAGLLHQGSVAACCPSLQQSINRAQAFADRLAVREIEGFSGVLMESDVIQRMMGRYALEKWTARRQ
jgi:lipoyl(octanoyl) transferase